MGIGRGDRNGAMLVDNKAEDKQCHLEAKARAVVIWSGEGRHEMIVYVSSAKRESGGTTKTKRKTKRKDKKQARGSMRQKGVKTRSNNTKSNTI